MKKILFLFIVMLALSQLAIGQNTFGVKGGFNISYQQQRLTPDRYPSAKTENFHALLGYQFGLFYKAALNSKWSVSGELNFSLIGSKIPYTTIAYTGDSVYINRQFDGAAGYLEVPLSVQYHINRFYVGIGPGVAFHLFHKSLDSFYLNSYKALDISGNLLAGYKITNKLDVNVRYNYGLQNILKNNRLYGSYDSNVSLKNRFFNVSVLYSFN